MPARKDAVEVANEACLRIAPYDGAIRLDLPWREIPRQLLQDLRLGEIKPNAAKRHAQRRCLTGERVFLAI